MQDLTLFTLRSYVGNNPLTYTDPSGHRSLRKLFRAVVAVAAIVFAPEIYAWAGQFGTAAFGSAAIGQGAVGGGILGFVAGGTAKSTLLGAFSGATFGWLGDATGGANIGIKASLHGFAGGFLNAIGGGDFGGGFFAGSFGALGGNVIPQTGNLPVDTLARGMIGGLAGQIGGGKFGNGAWTAAYGYLFNDAAHPKKTLLGEVNGGGSSQTFDAGRSIMVEPYSQTIGVDPFAYEVDYRYYDSNGKLLPMAVPLNGFGNPIPAFSASVVTGQGSGWPTLTFTAPELSVDGASTRIQWRVTIPQQIETHQNSTGWNLRVYRID